ncbi:MAG TPA: formate/nitrite transporter family protein, partial [Solirubrobacteraceae bacterium]|nr:formate/nitrite transporter family protein [Solirubrobacteraceae bacterium]
SSADAAVSPHLGTQAGHLAGALAFGIAFVFITIGRSELFTENFMVPVIGLRPGLATKLKLAELWVVSLVLNLAGGAILILVATTHGVLPAGAGHSLRTIALHADGYDLPTAFASAIVGGALITLMTWLIEGSPTPGTRVLVAWIAGAVLALGSFDHVVVVTLEMIFGIRYGAPIAWSHVLANVGVAAAGNMLGGLAFVTLTRTGQAIGSSDGEAPLEDGPPAAA